MQSRPDTQRLPAVLRIAILMVVIPVGGAVAIFLIFSHTPAAMLVAVVWVLVAAAAGLWLIAAAHAPNHPADAQGESPPSAG